MIISCTLKVHAQHSPSKMHEMIKGRTTNCKLMNGLFISTQSVSSSQVWPIPKRRTYIELRLDHDDIYQFKIKKNENDYKLMTS